MTRAALAMRRYSESFDLAFPPHTDKIYSVTLGLYGDNRLGEVFISSKNKVGTDADLAARDTAVLISMALQHGATIERLMPAMTHSADGRPEGLAGHVLAALARWEKENGLQPQEALA